MIANIYESVGSSSDGRVELPDGLDQKISSLLQKAGESKTPARIFFRADDIGPPSRNFVRMMNLFIRYRIPLCLAVVPAWLTQPRWDAMGPFLDMPELFCWHMHGYRHQNHENRGKKQEFGTARPADVVANDLSRGLDRLESIMQDDLFPVFTPPWNRCSTDTMALLKQMGFKAVSRSHGSGPEPPEGLPDIRVHVDLHTRKDADSQTGWTKLINELETGLSTGVCGIMLHHMRMNDAAFFFLDYLLDRIAGTPGLQTVSYKDLV